MKKIKNHSVTTPNGDQARQTTAPDPRKKYGNPDKLKDDPGLSNGAKLSLLRQWKLDLDRLLDSESEGMSTQTAITAEREANLANEERRVSEVLSVIEQDIESDIEG